MKKINDKYKILFLFIGALVILIISAIIMIASYKTSKEEIVPPDKRMENVDLTNFENNEVVSQVIQNNMNNKAARKGCKLLSKYSEDYPSVMQWMLEEVCNEINTNGWIDYEELEQEGEFDEIDVLEQYGSAENYITELLNNNPDTDISDLLLTFCPDKYNALKNTYILGKDSNTEYGISESQNSYNKLIVMYYEGKYEEITTEIESIIESKKLTLPYNYQLCNLYQDAKASKGYGSNTSGYIYGLDFMHSPETYISNFMKLTNSEKTKFILDDSSIVPFSYTYINMKKTFEVEESEYIRFKNMYPAKFESCEVRGYEFEVPNMKDDNTYRLIISCNLKENKYQIVSIYCEDGNSLYKTVSEIKGTKTTIIDENGEEHEQEQGFTIKRPDPIFIENQEEVIDDNDSDYDDSDNNSYDDYNDYDNYDNYQDYEDDSNLDDYEDGDTIISEEYID